MDEPDAVDFDLDDTGTLTVLAPTYGEGRYIRQVRGAGGYGHLDVLVSPHQGPRQYRFEWRVQEGTLPLPFMRSASLEGVKAALARPVQGDERVSDVLVTIVDGSYHDTDSTPTAVRIAASMAVMDALSRAELVKR